MKDICPFRSMKATLLICVLALFTAAISTSHFAPQPGDLDTTFGNGGKVIDGFSYGDDYGRAVAVQSDGKIVAVCDSFALVRYNTDGSLDSSFDGDGRVRTVFGRAWALAIQPDGKIVVAGDTNVDFALIRYNIDGSLDTSFGGDGKVVTSVGASDDYAFSVAIQPDGKIVAAGASDTGVNKNDYDFALVRYNIDGSLDTSFDGDGKVTTMIGASHDLAFSVAVQSDGKIVAAGKSDDYRGTLVRYNTDGSLDTSFDGDGIVLVPNIGATNGFAISVAIQADGKIVAAGPGIAIVRYNADGSLDTSFGGDGSVVIPVMANHFDNGISVAIQSDGKIVAVGLGRYNDALCFALVRVNPNGSPDTTFDTDGIVFTPFGSGTTGARSVAIQSDGRIVAVGNSYIGLFNGWDVAVARYNTDGSLDASFDGDGKVTTNFDLFTGNRLDATAIQPDGKIVAVGIGSGWAVVRYNADGSPDPTFGDNGKVTNAGDHVPHYLAIQADGKIVIAKDRRLFRYDTNGTPDPTFGSGGTVFSDVGFTAFSIDADGKIVGAGGICLATDEEGNCTSDGFVLVRFNSNGSVDASFNGGMTITPVGTYFYYVAIQPDGRIVAAGSRNTGPGDYNYDFALARYNTNGALDTSFDGDGTVTTPIGQRSAASSVAMQTDGKIVALGNSFNGSNYDFVLVRYNTDGSLDSSFDDDGKVIRGYDYGTYSNAKPVTIQPDGKIVAVDPSYNGMNYDFALVRYNTNGSLDTTFGGGDGITSVDFNNSNDEAMGMALDGHGRAVVVGASDGAFALARFILGPGAVVSMRAPFDFDGDGRSDVSVFRPSDRVWYLDRSTQGFTALQFGISTDKIVPADYDGDGKTDIAIFRDGTWWWMNSSTSTVEAVQFGVAGDVPVPADYTGDGRDEFGVYRNGQWWSLDLSNGNSALTNFGVATDKPVPADYDGDGKTDIAIYRDGTWWRINSRTGSVEVLEFGLASDQPVVGDYDGDSKADLAVYRDGTWYLQQSSQGFAAFQFGIATDVPTPADYDGDGKTDAAVYRNGTWYVLKSTGGVSIQQFGLAGDRPIPAAYTQ